MGVSSARSIFRGAWVWLWIGAGVAHAQVPVERQVPPRSFVFAGSVGLNLGILPLPAGEASIFLGATPGRFALRRGHWLAFGYKGAVSSGGADAFAVDAVGFSDLARVVHRHHFALHGVAGRRGRLAYGASVGPVIFYFARTRSDEAPPGGSSFGLEGEGRLGRVFGKGEPTGPQGVVGGLLRVSGALVDRAVAPTLGFFIGVVFAPGLSPPPARRGPSRAVPAPAPDHDRDGVADARDGCPHDAGPGPDGCPAIDRDGEGVFEMEDRCPDAAGTRNGLADDGCPDGPDTIRGDSAARSSAPRGHGSYLELEAVDLDPPARMLSRRQWLASPG